MHRHLAYEATYTKKLSLAATLIIVITLLGAAANVAAQTEYAEFTKLSYATGKSTDYFGRSLSVDGNTMIVGADEFDLTAPNSRDGAAFIYTRLTSGAWVLQHSLFPVTGSNDHKFGNCVGVSGDTAIVGAPGEEAAYIYVRNGGVWALEQRITRGTQTGFGQNCAISGNTVIISSRNEPGGGAAYIYVRGGTWAEQARLAPIAGSFGAIIGDAVAIDGDTAVVGAPSDDGFRGSVQVFRRSEMTWSPEQRLLANEGVAGDLFAMSVAVHGDTIVAGAPQANGPNAQREGYAYAFLRTGAVWTQQQRLTASGSRPQAEFGTSVAIEGNTAVVGSIRNNPVNGFQGGLAYIFERSGTAWTRTQGLLPADNHGDRFGFTADISGTTVIVGATQDVIGQNSEQGSVSVFTPNPATCTFSLSQTGSSLFPSGGGAGNFTVTTQEGCSWQATLQDRVLWTTTSSASTGSGTVNYSVAGNTGAPRRAAIAINGHQVYYVNQAAGQPSHQGELDQSFGNAGFTTNRVFEMSSTRRVKVQPDGKIVVAGDSFTNGTGGGAQLLRLNTDGTLDAAFDGDGIVTTVIDEAGVFTDIVLQPDGKIVAAGGATLLNGDTNYIVARYNSDGSLDPTFGTGGIVRTDLGSFSENASAVGQTPDGKIFVVGTTAENTLGVARYNANGSLDASFDSDGKAIVPNVFYGISDAAVQPDGKIVAAATWDASTVFVRLNTDGSLDATFGGDGRVEIPQATLTLCRAVTVQPDGKIVGAGTAASRLAVVRLNPSGSLDTSFAGDGSANTDVFAGAYDIALQSNSKVVVTGSTFTSNTFEIDTVVMRFNVDGSPDTTFGGDGKVIANEDPTFQDARDTGTSVALAPDGKIVIAGDHRARGPQDVMVLRLLGEGSTIDRTRFDYDGDGRSDRSVFRPSTGAWYLDQSEAGFFGALFGEATDRIAPADYDGDSRTDIAVYRPSLGLWYILNSSTSTVSYPVFGSAEDLPTPGDYDGDGKADVGVYRPSTSTFYRVNSSDGSFSGVQFGAVGDRPTIDDYDGDGKSDIGIYRPSDSTWYQLNSSNGTFFGELFGATGDRIAPADYDGDGKTDIAVYRPSESLWVIRRSSTATYDFVVFGIAEDLPAVGDYDGDGKADLAVFRPSTGYWYALNSSNGAFTSVQWGAGGDIPTPNAFGN